MNSWRSDILGCSGHDFTLPDFAVDLVEPSEVAFGFLGTADFGVFGLLFLLTGGLNSVEKTELVDEGDGESLLLVTSGSYAWHRFI